MMIIIIFITLITKGISWLVFWIVNRLLLNGTSEPSHPIYKDVSSSTTHWGHGARDNGLRSLMFNMRSLLSLSSSSLSSSSSSLSSSSSSSSWSSPKPVYVSWSYPTKKCITSDLSALIEANLDTSWGTPLRCPLYMCNWNAMFTCSLEAIWSSFLFIEKGVCLLPGLQVSASLREVLSYCLASLNVCFSVLWNSFHGKN